MEGTQLAPRLRHRPVAVTTSTIVLLFLGVTALAGGIEMILFPSGNDFLPGRWLDEIPVIDSWLVPGLVLSAGFGVGSLVTAYSVIRRPHWPAGGQHWSWLATILIGAGMMAWIGLELAYLPERSWLEAIYGLVGVLLVGLPLSPSARAYLRPDRA